MIGRAASRIRPQHAQVSQMFKPEFEDTEYDRGKYMLKILGLTVSGHAAAGARGPAWGGMHGHGCTNDHAYVRAPSEQQVACTHGMHACCMSVG